MASVTEFKGCPTLSSNGRAQLEKGKVVLQMNKNMRDAYHPQSNPNGNIDLGVAANSLMHHELGQFFERDFHLIPKDFAIGDSFTGTDRIRNALSSFLNTYFEPHRPVLPHHIIVGAGLLALMSQVARVIADPGEGVLLVEPYYPGFEASLMLQNGVIPVGVPVPLADMMTLAEVSHLERRLHESVANGVPIKAVILCNPHNPLGRCYPRDVLIAYCQFCETHNLHLLSDEIYALSVFPSRDVPHPEPFISVLSLDVAALGVNPSRVHVLYGMSKDFNANGFRAGLLVSQANAQLLQSLIVSALFMVVASPTDVLWSKLLTDKTYLPEFLSTNPVRLREAYEYMTAWLTFHGLPYIPSSAGHFLMVDFRPVLSDVTRYGSIFPISEDQSMQERELVLSAHLSKHKVSVMRGMSCHMPEGGWFRFTFSIRRDVVDVALARFETALLWEPWPRGSTEQKPKESGSFLGQLWHG